MNEALISGLLGAVMGGASSMEKSIGEEMAAKQKEEEEKRREERALTIAERKLEMEAAKKKRLEEARRGEIAGYLPSAGGATPSQSPMEPEGGGITEYQIPTEQRLVRAAEAATAKGDVEAAKIFSDQYRAMMQEQRAQAKEERDVAKALAEPMEKTPERIKVLDELTGRFYKQSGGGYDEEGNPTDQKAFASASKKAEDYVFLTMRERMGIAPGAASGEKPPRAITPKEETAARNSLQRDLARLSEVTDAKGKVTRDPLMWESLNKITSRIIKEDRTKLLDPGLADEARAEVQAAVDRARTDIRADLEKKTDAKGEPLSREQMRKNEAILKNQYSLDRYTKENLPKYVNRYLGGGAAEEPKRGGRPWERSWGSME